MHYRLSFFCLLLVLVSCGQSKEYRRKIEEKQLELMAAEVMAIHDEVMPKTMGIFKLKKQLKEIEAASTDTIVKQEIFECVQQLEAADKGMMDWMHQYKTPDEFLPFEEKKAYYTEQKKKIDNVKEDILMSMDMATLLINKYEKK